MEENNKNDNEVLNNNENKMDDSLDNSYEPIHKQEDKSNPLYHFRGHLFHQGSLRQERLTKKSKCVHRQ